ncbi:hypothetical protein KUCAC02_025671 [Chaenocephalus aceratus]|uniref:Uncharacterized protein n=1 Tax=Chaenocephalus aceratus TaxID=36190 RepID=A0ACB9VVQ3_CHAAC|nr:hypothetical protein KUCAC02_025671 [Chaenocephalus aceratus]
MERGLHFGNVSISLVLLLLLNALIGFGTSQAPGSATGREPQFSTRGSASTSGDEDGARAMERRSLENVGPPVIVADVTVEDDDNGSAGETDESFGDSNGNIQPTSMTYRGRGQPSERPPKLPPSQRADCLATTNQPNILAGFVIQWRGSLVIISTLDGRISALDPHNQGRKQWDLDVASGCLVSSSISKPERLGGGLTACHWLASTRRGGSSQSPAASYQSLHGYTNRMAPVLSLKVDLFVKRGMDPHVEKRKEVTLSADLEILKGNRDGQKSVELNIGVTYVWGRWLKEQLTEGMLANQHGVDVMVFGNKMIIPSLDGALFQWNRDRESNGVRAFQRGVPAGFILPDRGGYRPAPVNICSNGGLQSWGEEEMLSEDVLLLQRTQRLCEPSGPIRDGEGEVASGDWRESQRVITDEPKEREQTKNQQNQNLDVVIKVSVPDWKVMAFSTEPDGQLVWERQFCTPIASAWLVGGCLPWNVPGAAYLQSSVRISESSLPKLSDRTSFTTPGQVEALSSYPYDNGYYFPYTKRYREKRDSAIIIINKDGAGRRES